MRYFSGALACVKAGMLFVFCLFSLFCFSFTSSSLPDRGLVVWLGCCKGLFRRAFDEGPRKGGCIFLHSWLSRQGGQAQAIHTLALTLDSAANVYLCSYI